MDFLKCSSVDFQSCNWENIDKIWTKTVQSFSFISQITFISFILFAYTPQTLNGASLSNSDSCPVPEHHIPKLYRSQYAPKNVVLFEYRICRRQGRTVETGRSIRTNIHAATFMKKKNKKTHETHLQFLRTNKKQFKQFGKIPHPQSLRLKTMYKIGISK